MGKFGYVFKKTDDGQELFEEYQRLIDFECQEVKISDNDLKTMVEIKELFPEIKQGDQLVFYSISGLGKTVKELLAFLELLREMGISACFIKEEILSNEVLFKSLAEIFEFILSIQRDVLKVKKEIAEASDEPLGEVGRPTIANEQVEQIVHHYLYEKMSYREISQATNLSIGTVHKYINQYKKQSLNN